MLVVKIPRDHTNARVGMDVSGMVTTAGPLNNVLARCS